MVKNLDSSNQDNSEFDSVDISDDEDKIDKKRFFKKKGKVHMLFP